jgi:hypothetical protein
VGATCFLTELHGAVIGTDGKYVGGALQATKIYTYPTPVAGDGSPAHPWPTATVMSLRVTSRTRGPGSHGRVYYPTLAAIVASATGRYQSTGFIGDSFKTLLNSLNVLAKTHFGPGVCVVNISPVGSGVIAAVNQLQVGNRPDHQERRENAAAESYAGYPITI